MKLKQLLMDEGKNIVSMIIESKEMTYSSSNISKIDLIPVEVGNYTLVLNEVIFDFTDEEIEKDGNLKNGVYYFDLGKAKIEVVLR